MSLTTHSRFYFGYEVTADNNLLDLDEGSGEITVELDIGSYTLTDFVAEIERALNENEDTTLDYTVSVNRVTRIITIAASATFDLLVATGSTIGQTVFTLAGFTGADRTGAATYNGNAASGSEYVTQFILQDHVPFDNYKGAAEGVVNKAASGKVEVVSFGDEEFMEANFKYVTNYNIGGHIRYNATGVENLRTFMEFLRTKAPVEFMPDENDQATFFKMILESTPQDSKGLKYKLKELYDKGLPGFFDTGRLVFRKVT